MRINIMMILMLLLMVGSITNVLGISEIRMREGKIEYVSTAYNEPHAFPTEAMRNAERGRVLREREIVIAFTQAYNEGIEKGDVGKKNDLMVVLIGSMIGSFVCLNPRDAEIIEMQLAENMVGRFGSNYNEEEVLMVVNIYVYRNGKWYCTAQINFTTKDLKKRLKKKGIITYDEAIEQTRNETTEDTVGSEKRIMSRGY